jgi:glycosyltransferase involved in cell wall biosynthesis
MFALTNEGYACSDYYIMTSKYEGQPLTLLEAMSSGLLLSLSDIPNLEIVEDANCGIIVDFSNIKRAKEEIISYLEEDNSNHSKNVREYALKNLDGGIIAGRYLDEFEKGLQ